MRVKVLVASILLFAGLTGCSDDPVVGPPSGPPDPLMEEVRQLANAAGISPMAPPAGVGPELVALGRALVFDKILSGNRDVSCMTCHLPSQGTSDGLSLSIGQGALGLGPGRVHPQGAFIPRNALPLFNLSAMRTHFWDGRLSINGFGEFSSPAGPDLTLDMIRVFEFGPISALGLFPVLSREEMRAFGGNELATIDDDDLPAIWEALMVRLGGFNEYRTLFENAYPGTPFDAMTFAHASNAMAAFFVSELSLVDTPWDRFLAGDDDALRNDQLRGAEEFLGIARCTNCHMGPTLSDEAFHNTALPQFGPGHGNGPSGTDDFGLFNVTGALSDRFRFRTPPLRNVELTAPYGHAGQFLELRDFVDHYSNAAAKLRTYDASQLDPLLQATLLANTEQILATLDPELDGIVLPPEMADRITAFLLALTDERARSLGHLPPPSVPSGLPIDR
jgi:cytochrome c peroxidase